jgi:ATP-dependent exoDNAse (exonuclease V) alpha subunit
MVLTDDRHERVHDYLEKSPDVFHSEVMLPKGADRSLGDREELWNRVEAVEKRRDAALAREITLALPRELSEAQNVELAREYVQANFVDAGMVADLNLHRGNGSPHAHVMLSTRSIEADGSFGKKVRAWDNKALLRSWRSDLAVRTNQALERAGSIERVDHRSFKERGIELEPGIKLGAAACRMAAKGLQSERVEQAQAIMERNRARIEAEPMIAERVLCEHLPAFTLDQAQRFMQRYGVDRETLNKLTASVVKLGRDSQGRSWLSPMRLAARAVETMAPVREAAAWMRDAWRQQVMKRAAEKLAMDRMARQERERSLERSQGMGMGR